MAGDRNGLVLSTNRRGAAARYREGIENFLSGRADPFAPIEAAIEGDPRFALAHAALGFLEAMRGSIKLGKAAVARAERLASDATARERSHVDVLARIVRGDEDARRSLRAHLAEHPRDALLLSVELYLFTLSSDADHNQQAIARLEPLAEAYGDDWYYLASVAVFSVEVGQFAEAEALAKRVLRRFPGCIQAAHSLAHAYYGTNRHARAFRFLSRWIPRHPLGGIEVHFWWHLAMAEFARGKWPAARRLYRKHIAPEATGHAVESLIDGVNLLWRARLQGRPEIPGAWRNLASLARTMAFLRTATPGLVMHGAIALIAAGDDETLDLLRAQVRKAARRGDAVARDVVAPVIEAFAAYARGDHSDAARRLKPVIPEAVRSGGSIEQREILQDTLVAAQLSARETRKRAPARASGLG